MKKSLLLLVIAISLLTPLSAVSMRFSADALAFFSHFTSDINTLRAGGETKLEIGDELGKGHDVMATFTVTASKEIDSTQIWTSVPPQVGFGVGMSYGYDFTDRFGLRSEIGIHFENNRAVENADSCFYAGLTPYVSLFKLKESYSSYELLFPVEATFSASRAEIKLGIGFAMHIAPRYGV